MKWKGNMDDELPGHKTKMWMLWILFGIIILALLFIVWGIASVFDFSGYGPIG